MSVPFRHTLSILLLNIYVTDREEIASWWWSRGQDRACSLPVREDVRPALRGAGRAHQPHHSRQHRRPQGLSYGVSHPIFMSDMQIRSRRSEKMSPWTSGS
jgi:hypothetical protein